MNRRLCSDCRNWVKDLVDENDKPIEEWGSCNCKTNDKLMAPVDKNYNLIEDVGGFQSHRNYGCINWFFKT